MLALQATLMINEEGMLSHKVINDALKKYDYLDERDKALFVRLVHGSLEYRLQSDYIIDVFSKVKTVKMKPVIRNILRLGVYQIFHMDKIPDSAAIDESVKLVKKKSLQGLSGFVNGVLRNISRNKDSIDLSKRYVRYSVPEWILEVLDASAGEDATDSYLDYTLNNHGIWIRNIEDGSFEYCNNASDVFGSKDWADGRIIVQDYHSAMAVENSSIKPGDTVFDVCAAPGGKSIQASVKTGTEGRVKAFDISEAKLDLIRENVLRTHRDNIDIRLCDAAEYHEEYAESCDVLIADLPCSGLGTLSGKPDVKYRLKPEDLSSLAKLQKEILNNVCRYVRPGGELVFSTCTIDKTENEDNVKAFLVSHDEYKLVSMKQYLPGEKPADGFFTAVMKKEF